MRRSSHPSSCYWWPLAHLAWTKADSGEGAKTRDEIQPEEGWHWHGSWKLSQAPLITYVGTGVCSALARVDTTACLFKTKTHSFPLFPAFSRLVSFFAAPHACGCFATCSHTDGWQYASSMQSKFKASPRNAVLRRRLWEREEHTTLSEIKSVGARKSSSRADTATARRADEDKGESATGQVPELGTDEAGGRGEADGGAAKASVV